MFKLQSVKRVGSTLIFSPALFYFIVLSESCEFIVDRQRVNAVVDNVTAKLLCYVVRRVLLLVFILP